MACSLALIDSSSSSTIAEQQFPTENVAELSDSHDKGPELSEEVGIHNPTFLSENSTMICGPDSRSADNRYLESS